MSSFATKKVRVEVTSVRDIGLAVKLLDGTRRTGRIRRRELDWDRSVNHQVQLPGLGEQREAVILEDESEPGALFLSLRRVVDPWAEFPRLHYRAGQSVEGEVVSVRPFGVYIQLQPGIDAIAWPEGMPVLPGKHVEDSLSVGDRVRAVITEINLAEQRIVLNLWREIDRCSVIDDAAPWRALFPGQPAVPLAARPPAPAETQAHWHAPIQPPWRILIVDNDETVLYKLAQCLEAEYGVPVDRTNTGPQALETIAEHREIGLVIIDRALQNGERGEDVAAAILEKYPDLALMLVSADWHVDEWLPIMGQRILATNKDGATIVDWIERMLAGYAETPDLVAGTVDIDRFLERLQVAEFARRPLRARLADMLQALQAETDATYAALLELDAAGRRITALQMLPVLPDYLQSHACSGLYHSLARNVIEDGEELLEQSVPSGDDGPFKNFFPGLNFQSCVGIPLRIMDQPARYGLFLLDRRRGWFDPAQPGGRHRLERARLTARHAAIAQQYAMLLDTMTQYQALYSQGQLLHQMAHEINHKLSGLQMGVATLTDRIEPLRQPAALQQWTAERLTTQAEAIGRVTDDINETKDQILDLVESYGRLARHDLELVDLNVVVAQAKLQLMQSAREKLVEIQVFPAQGPLQVRAVGSRLAQVVINLVLNAIQQIENHHSQLLMARRVAERDVTCLVPRLIVIETGKVADATGDVAYIKVIDSGPGIHWRDEKLIFQSGYSTRKGGAGLGLFISRNIVELMGGTLTLNESIMFMGSAFIAALPAYSGAGGGQ
jgi:signal transduction histidine kinase